MLKILYDHQVFTTQQWGGISRYFSELMKGMSAMDEIDISSSTKFSNNEYLSHLEKAGISSFFPGHHFPGRIHLQSILNKYSTLHEIRKGEFDIFHPTYYNPYYFKKIKTKPVIITVYDMIHERLPAFFSKKDRTSDFKRRVVEKADRIIAISKKTKDDLIEIFGVDEEKVDVVYLGNSLNNIDFRQNDIPPLPSKYILFVGFRGGYKNFMNFIKAVHPFIKKDDDLHLVCVGGGKFNQSETDCLSMHGIFKKSVQISCNDHELTYIYKNAQCFVFPSLYEGFGLPILEAFSAECPIACSKCGSLPEVAGDAAVLFNPESEHEMREKIHEVLYDDVLRQQLIKKGEHRGRMFSWEETVQQTREIYESMV